MNLKTHALKEENLPFLSVLLGEPDILSALHNKPYSVEQLAEYYHEIWKDDADEAQFILEADGQPVGWLKLNGLLDETRSIAWVSMLAVSPRHQHQGIGSHAVRFAEDYFRDRGFQKAGIHTTKDNLPARRAYTRLGYAVTEIGPCTTGDGVRRVGYTFEKSLNPSIKE